MSMSRLTTENNHCWNLVDLLLLCTLMTCRSINSTAFPVSNPPSKVQTIDCLDYRILHPIVWLLFIVFICIQVAIEFS